MTPPDASDPADLPTPLTKGVRLTKARIAEGVALARRQRRDVILWCVEPPGFGCRIRETGAASFIFQYRPRGGRRSPVRKLTIGKTEVYSPDEARQVARRHAQAVAEGRDPQAEKMSARQIPTLRELFETYLAAEEGRLSPRTLSNARSHMRNQLAPLLATRIDMIRKSDLSALHGRQSETPYAANRAMATLSAVFGFAEARDLLPPNSNPARGLRRYRERNRIRMLTAEEVAALWSALIDLQAEEAHRFAAPAIMLGMLTGWRVGEVRTLRWEAVDMTTYEATISGKTGARRAPFPGSTHKLLHYLAAVSPAYGEGEHRAAWVFPSLAGATRERGGSPIGSIAAVGKRRLRPPALRMCAGMTSDISSPA